MSTKAESLTLQWARYYAETCKFSVIPTAKGEKRPGVAWEPYQHIRAPISQIEAWFTGLYRECGVGLVTGGVSGQVAVIDCDCGPGKLGPDTLDDLQLAYDDLPHTWTVKTGGGGRHYYFRFPAGLQIKTGTDVLGPSVDVRGEGGFLVMPPSPHPSGNIYEWAEGCDPECVDIATAPDWLAYLCRDDAAHPDRAGRAGAAEGTSGTGGTDKTDPFGRRFDGREVYMRDLIWARLVQERRESPILAVQSLTDSVFAHCWPIYARHVKARGTSLEEDGRGEAEMRRKIRYALKRWDSRLKRDAEKPQEEKRAAEPPPSEDGGVRPLKIIRPLPIRPSQIPRRPYILKPHIIRKLLTVLAAPPGAGKSLFTIQIALSLCSGRAWAGWSPEKQFKILIINSEDDSDEMQRRFVAAMQVMGVRQDEVADNLFVADAPETIVIARTDARTKTVTRTPLVEEIIAAIEAHSIDVVIVDPFAETFEGDENSNSELKWAAVLWREIARRTKTGVYLVHHTKKYSSGMSGDADAARGASALIGVARFVSTMFPMTEAEAELMAVTSDERRRYVRHDDAKANLALITGSARWFEKRSQMVGNGVLGVEGDEVGVLVPWNPPGLFAGISIDTIRQVLTVIQAGVLDDDGRPTGHFFTTAANTPRWAGYILIEAFGCNRKRAFDMLAEWLRVKPGDENGLLVEIEFHDGKQPRKGLRVDFSKLPGMEI